MAPIDWIVVAAYLVVVAWLGTRLARRQTSTEAYFIGGRAIPWWAVGCSFFGTSISTATFIALPGQAYGGDWRPHLANMMFPLSAVFIALVVIPFYRQRVRMSAYEFLEERFGYGARCYTSCFYLISRLFRSGLVLFLMAKAISAMTGWSPFTIVLVSGVIALIYTILGGLEAVIWTDVIQSVTLFGGGLFCVAILWFGEDGSTQLLSVAQASDKFRMVDWSLDLSEMTVLVTIAYGGFGFLSNYTVQQDAAQRYLASPSTRDAQKAIWFGAIGCVVTWNLFMLIGSLLFSYYSLHPAELPAHIAASETEVFPYFVVTRIPAGMTGVILAGMCAAAMSSLDTMINSMAMVTVRDFYLHFRPEASDRSQLILGRGRLGGLGSARSGRGTGAAAGCGASAAVQLYRLLDSGRRVVRNVPAGLLRETGPRPGGVPGPGLRGVDLGLDPDRPGPGGGGRRAGTGLGGPTRRDAALPLPSLADPLPGQSRLLRRRLGRQSHPPGHPQVKEFRVSAVKVNVKGRTADQTFRNGLPKNSEGEPNKAG